MDRDDNIPHNDSQSRPQHNQPTNQDPFSQLQKALDTSINHLFNTVIALPAAIYEQGNQHGKEWYRTLHKHQVEQENDEAMMTSAEEGTTCPYLPHPRDRVEATQEQCPYLPHTSERVERRSEISEGDVMRALRSGGECVRDRSDKSEISQEDVMRAALGNGECARHDEGNDWVSSILKELGMTNRRHQDRARDVCPYFQSDEDPEGEFPGRRSRRQETEEHEEGFRYPNGDRPHPTPFGHILASAQYSPTALEKQHDDEKDWQAMFQDLLRIQGEDPASPSRHDLEEQRQVQDYHDWLLHRVIPTAYEDHRRGMQRSPSQEHATEEAAYDTIAPPSVKPTTTPNPAVTSAPSVLSSLTRTETIQTPDGSIIEKRVLRQRFSDGREEVTETTSTSLGKQKEEQTRRFITYASEVSEGKVLGELKKGDEGKLRRGWFWNSG